jgi:hypothetical protein
MKTRHFAVRRIITALVLAQVIGVPRDGWWGDIVLCGVQP